MPSQKKPPLLPLILDDVPRGLRRALAQEGVPFRDRLADVAEGRFVLFDSRNRFLRSVAPGQIAIDINDLRSVADGDPFELLLDQRSERFEWHVAGLTLREQITRVDKRDLRGRLLQRLRGKIEDAGGVWLRVWPFPFPYHSAFSVRIDYDEYDPDDFDRTLKAIAGNEHATSHYVNGAAYEPFANALNRLEGLHVGSHGYRHHTYCTVEENVRNIARGIQTLQRARIEPRGFAAPHGRFNRELLSALETLEVKHSSEFGLACDELPFFAGTGDVLQIPVHPVCLGMFLEAARRSGGDLVPETENMTVRAAIAYFEQFAEARYRMGEPVFLYGHPTGRLGRYPQLLKQIFATVSRFDAVWATNLHQFGDWWRARAKLRATVTMRNDQLIVQLDSKPSAYRVGIEYVRGQHVALIPADKNVVSFSPSALPYENRATRPPVHPVRVDRPEGLRARVRRMIDWERVTPIDEIGTGTWRNRVKRTLRRMWD